LEIFSGNNFLSQGGNLFYFMFFLTFLLYENIF
jgi:hypothetical protein